MSRAAGGQSGLTVPAWRVADVRAAERSALAAVPADALMIRAASGLARRCLYLLRAHGRAVVGAQVVVLAGPGNNGGDALFAGAELARRGVAVTAILGERSHVAGAVALSKAGGRIANQERASVVLPRARLILDGLVGIGGRGGLRPHLALLAEEAAAARSAGAVVVAVDVPSGVDADTGAVEGAAMSADFTVTFGCHKPGLHLGAGALRAGTVECVDIGLLPYLMAPPALALTTAAGVREWWPRPGRTDDKYSRGVAGIAAGSVTYPGAALLATGGALAGPVGMIRYAGPSAERVVAAHPEVVATAQIAEAGQVQAWVCGPGLGTDAPAAYALRVVLNSDLPILLDGDAITLVASRRDALHRRHTPLIITPHDREFVRLVGKEVGVDRLAAAQGAAESFGATVLLKGDRTIVASPGKTPLVNPTGSPELATAGSGDVLSGLVGSLLAAGVEPHHAAAAGAFMHGLAGSAAARQGPVTASCVAAALPATVRQFLSIRVLGSNESVLARGLRHREGGCAISGSGGWRRA